MGFGATLNFRKSNQMLVFEERGKPEFPEKNLSGQSREPTNSAHMIVASIDKEW